MNSGRQRDGLGFDNRLEEYYSVQRALAMYGFGLKEYEVLKNGYWLRTNRGIKRLMRFDGTEREMRFVYAATEHCSKNGLNEFYRIYPSQSGAPFIKIEGKIYYLTDYTMGSECDFSNPWQLKSVAQLLARFHRASTGLHLPDELRDVRVFWGGWRDKFKERNEFLRHVKEQDESREYKGACHRRFMRYIDDFIALGEESLEELDRGLYDEVVERERAIDAFCHGRYNRKNIEVVPERGIVITDFAHCKRDIRLDDLAGFIFRVGEWDTDKALFILESYHKEIPLGTEDIKLILAYLRYPSDFCSVAKAFYLYDREHPVRLKAVTRSLRKRYAFLEAMERVDYSFLIGPSVNGADWASEYDFERRALSRDESPLQGFEHLIKPSAPSTIADVYEKTSMDGDDRMDIYNSLEDFLPEYQGIDPEQSIGECIDALRELEDDDEYMLDDLDILLERMDALVETMGLSDQGDGMEPEAPERGGLDRVRGSVDAEVESEYGFSVGELFSDLAEMEKASEAEKIAVGNAGVMPSAGEKVDRELAEPTAVSKVVNPMPDADGGDQSIGGAKAEGPKSCDQRIEGGKARESESGDLRIEGAGAEESESGGLSADSAERSDSYSAGTIRWKPFPKPLKRGGGR